MPVLDGFALYDELARRQPGLERRMIFASGDVLDRYWQDRLAATGAPVIAKPFRLAEALETVRAMVEGKA